VYLILVENRTSPIYYLELCYLAFEFDERMKKLDEVVSHLDKHCGAILAYLSVIFPEEIGFNELFRKFKKLKGAPSFSKGTLGRHLEHLLKEQLIVVREDKDSRLKIKPRKYKLSPYFVEISQDMLEHKLLDPIDALHAMRLEEIQPLTIVLIDIFLGNICEILKNTIKYPEKIADYQRTSVFYYHFENYMKAYRARVLENNEKEKALKTIDDFNKYWVDVRNEKWGDLIATIHAYTQIKD